jgi:hypothetical protein
MKKINQTNQTNQTDMAKIKSGLSQMIEKNNQEVESLAVKIQSAHNAEQAVKYATQLKIRQRVNDLYESGFNANTDTLEEFVEAVNYLMRDALRMRLDVRTSGAMHIDGLVFVEAANSLYTLAKVNFVSREEFKFAQTFELVRMG